MRLDTLSRQRKVRERRLRQQIEATGSERVSERHQPSASSLAQCAECCIFRMRALMIKLPDSEYEEFVCKECSNTLD